MGKVAGAAGAGPAPARRTSRHLREAFGPEGNGGNFRATKERRHLPEDGKPLLPDARECEVGETRRAQITVAAGGHINSENAGVGRRLRIPM